jgi:hypothetical protein
MEDANAFSPGLPLFAIGARVLPTYNFFANLPIVAIQLTAFDVAAAIRGGPGLRSGATHVAIFLRL